MAFIIGTALFILKPAMTYYGGLSGLACGFIFYCALLGVAASNPRRKISKLIIFFLPIKILLESYNNASILPYWGQQTFVIMPVSHITGIVVALLFYFVLKAGKLYWAHMYNIDRQAG